MIKVIADTLSCINVAKAKQLDIPLIPQIIIIDQETYRDDTEIDTKTFFMKLVNAKEHPRTAAPSPEFYRSAYQKIIQQGDTPFVICPSSEMSGTFRSATVAARDFPEAHIQIVDTPSMGAGLGVMVQKAVAWANENHTAAQIEAGILKMASRERIYFSVDSLEYLHKGGRIGGAQAFLGILLQVKPILQFRNRRIEPIGRQRTQNRTLAYLRSLVDAQCPKNNNSYLSLMHGGNKEEATRLAEELGRIIGEPSPPVYEIPAAFLVHGGPGALGISFFV